MITSSLEARQYWCLLPEHDPLLGLLILLLHILHVHEGRVGIGLFGVRIREGRFVTKRNILDDFDLLMLPDLPQGMLVHGFLLGWQ